jgi:hypothetical protein
MFGLLAGLLGAVSAILVTETLTFSSNWMLLAVGSVISIIVSIIVVNNLYERFIEFTKDSQDAIRNASRTLKNR